MSRRLNDRTAVITGAANGIGRAAALRFAQEGARLVMTDIDAEAVKAAGREAEAAGAEVLALGHDVSREEDWSAVMEQAQARFGAPDIVINNAGVGRPTPLLETSLEEWRRTTSVNLDGVFLGCRFGIAAMLGPERGPRERQGSVINVSSAYGLVGRAGAGAYSASKGGVRLLTKSLALEAGANGWNIRVNSLHPGYVRTGMAEGAAGRMAAKAPSNDGEAALAALHPIGRIAETSEMADAMLFLASDESSFMTGSELVVDGGFTAI